jgi:F-type H+-transporting ATPase subunit gamma
MQIQINIDRCFRSTGSAALRTGETRQKDAGAIGAVVFGSDQGLAGQFMVTKAGRAKLSGTVAAPVCLGPSSYPDRYFSG